MRRNGDHSGFITSAALPFITVGSRRVLFRWCHPHDRDAAVIGGETAQQKAAPGCRQSMERCRHTAGCTFRARRRLHAHADVAAAPLQRCLQLVRGRCRAGGEGCSAAGGLWRGLTWAVWRSDWSGAAAAAIGWCEWRAVMITGTGNGDNRTS